MHTRTTLSTGLAPNRLDGLLAQFGGFRLACHRHDAVSYRDVKQSRIYSPRPRRAIRRMCPVVGSWPDRDLTTKSAAVLEDRLTAAGIAHDLKVYPATKHAFFNDQWRSYHPAAAADSWQRVLAFFDEHVRGTPGRSRADPGPPAPRGGPGSAIG